MKHIWTTNERAVSAQRWRGRSVWLSAVATVLAFFGELALWGRSHWKWDADWLPPLVTVLRIGLLATSAISVVVALRRDKVGEARVKNRGQVGSMSRGLLPELADITGAPIQALGISVWAVVPMTKADMKKMDVRGKWGKRPEILSRVDQTRLTQHPLPLNHTLRKGVGVIGACWESQKEVYKDFRKYHERFKNGRISNSAWKKIRNTWGFTQAEYPIQMVRYSDILAVPIKDRAGRFYGCVSLDLGADHASVVTRFDSIEVREILTRHARGVYDTLNR